MSEKTPVILAILDGWGYRAEEESNAIAQASTPVWDYLWANYPHSLIEASEMEVGLPCGQMGNSEVGHMNIGAGRIIKQDLPRIDQAIEENKIKANPKFQTFINRLKASGGDCHLAGLFSDGGVHAHQSHLTALAKLIASENISVWIHAFLDGRDVPPKSAKIYLKQWEKTFAQDANVTIATLSGRYYAMDRDRRWERVHQAFDAIVHANATKAENTEKAIDENYREDRTDEFVKPTIIGDYQGIKPEDGLLMANFRADRVRQLLHALVDPTFKEFERPGFPPLSQILGMVEYSEELAKLVPAIFPPETPTNTLGEVIDNKGLKQLHIAETEKYAHVTFFLNGGREAPFSKEDRILIPSPDVPTYDMKPEMSAQEVTDKLVEATQSKQYDFIVVNYANTDMVGHSGDMNAAMQAVETVDNCLGRLWKALQETRGYLLITADHGNAEQMMNPANQQPHTAHTLNPVPCLLASNPKLAKLKNGRLADIAPTVLELMNIPQPTEMTGNSLLAKRRE